MVPRKKGQKYEISYRCPNYEKPFSERFDSYEAAKLRIAQIEYEKSLGVFEPPKRAILAPRNNHYVTVGELLDEYVQLYGLKHWGDSYLSSSQHYIAHYVKPTIGDVPVKDITTHDLDVFYDALLDQPAVVLKGHQKKDEKISPSVIVKIHALMSGAFKKAIGWKYISINPAENATLPERVIKERDSWSASEVKYALAICENPVLKLAMLLALGCSMRIGEVLGLTWDCVDLAEESLAAGNASLFINKELKRCQKSSLEALEKRRTVPDPDAHGVVGRRPDGPCVAVAVARPGLPADLLRRGKILPLALLLGARDAADRLEHQPHQENKYRKPE